MVSTPGKDRRFVHSIDRDDVIVHLNEDWLAFGRENGAPWGSVDEVLGRSLWSFISDEETRQLYHAVLERVRAGAPPIRLPFRCDAPHRRRFMEMGVGSAGDGTVWFRSRLLREEPRRPVTLLDPWTDRGPETVRMCGWCKQVWLEEGRWVEAEVAMAALELFALSPPPQLIQGTCPACYDTVRDEIAAAAGFAVPRAS